MLGLATLGTGIEPPAGEDATRSRAMPHRPRAGRLGGGLRRPSARGLADARDGRLFAGPASERRRFLDRLVLAVDAEHPSRVNALERALRSRNRLLEEPRPDPHWLDAIEHETAEVAVAVAAQRAETVRRLQAALARAARTIAFPVGRDRARRLDGAAAAGASRDRGRGPLSRHAARQSRARRRRRPHARRPASHRSRGASTRRKSIAAADASTGEQKALLIGLVLAHAGLRRRDDRLRAGAAARRGGGASRSRRAARRSTTRSPRSARRSG